MISRRGFFAASMARKQTGAALLVLLLVVLVVSAGALVSKASDARARQERAKQTQAALVNGKRALLEFALSHPDRVPGEPVQLPCPDRDASATWIDGESHTTDCGAAGVSVLGRFPWRTAGGHIARDASVSCLWYAVSGSYKSAGSDTAAMINPDSNGQFEVFDAVSGALVGSGLPEDRPVAIVLAPLEPLAGQTRAGAGSSGCAGNYAAADYLDGVSALGISNASLTGAAHAVDQFVSSAVASEEFNDRILAITRDELADAIYRRTDLASALDALTRGVASCVAAYGLSNPSGPSDRRLPWPASVGLLDYASAGSYDDVDNGQYSGRLADRVDDSNLVTANAIQRILTDCNPAVATDWDAAMLPLWQQWKDHFFYVVAESFQAGAPTPTACGTCLSVNGGGQYAAVVLFAGRRLPALAQRRDSPPLDTDTKQDIANYLEGANSAVHPYLGGPVDYASAAVSANFNDKLYCIDGAMSVTSC